MASAMHLCTTDAEIILKQNKKILCRFKLKCIVIIERNWDETKFSLFHIISTILYGAYCPYLYLDASLCILVKS